MTPIRTLTHLSVAALLTLALAGSAQAESLVLTNECLGDLSACTAASDAGDPGSAPAPVEVAKRSPSRADDSAPLTLSNADLEAPAPRGFETPTEVALAEPAPVEAPSPVVQEAAVEAPIAEVPVAADSADPVTRTIDDIPQRLTVADDATVAEIEAADAAAAGEPVAEAAEAPLPDAAPEGEALEVAPDAGSEAWVFQDGDGTLASTQDDPGEKALDLAGCMERSIRAGNAYGETTRVCEALFPR